MHRRQLGVSARQVAADLEPIGVSVPGDLLLRLADDLPAGLDGWTAKTSYWFGTHEHRRIGRVEIRSGMPATQTGAVLAHEFTHVWLHLAGAPEMEPIHEEGVCELVATRWLRGCGEPDASMWLHQIANRTDGLYAQGYRLAARAERVHGLHAVLEVACRDGRIPGIEPVSPSGDPLPRLSTVPLTVDTTR